MSYVRADRDQLFLMPPDVRDWLSPGHAVWVLLDVLADCDLGAFYRGGEVKTETRGRRAFDPAWMVAVLMWAYMHGVESSREIERACETDVAFRVITGNRVVDHSTIAAFRKEHLGAFTELFVEVLALCVAAGFDRLGVLALDGTKLAAAASLAANVTAERARRLVEEVVARAEAVDREEDVMYGEGRRGDEVPAVVPEDPGARREFFRRLREERSGAGVERGTVMAGESEVSDVAAGVDGDGDDDEMGVEFGRCRDRIVAYRETLEAERAEIEGRRASKRSQAARARQARVRGRRRKEHWRERKYRLLKQRIVMLGWVEVIVLEFERRHLKRREACRAAGTDRERKTIRIDADYHAYLWGLFVAWLDALIENASRRCPPSPDPGTYQRNRTDPESRIMQAPSGAFIQGYNAQAAVGMDGICWACDVTNEANDFGQLLPLTGQAVTNIRAVAPGRAVNVVLADAGYLSEANLEHAENDPGCPAFLIATSNRHNLGREPREFRGPRVRKMRETLDTPAGRYLYRRRASTVEPHFGQIKHNRKKRQFLLRGNDVRGEWTLVNTALNLAKLVSRIQATPNPG